MKKQNLVDNKIEMGFLSGIHVGGIIDKLNPLHQALNNPIAKGLGGGLNAVGQGFKGLAGGLSGLLNSPILIFAGIGLLGVILVMRK